MWGKKKCGVFVNKIIVILELNLETAFRSSSNGQLF